MTRRGFFGRLLAGAAAVLLPWRRASALEIVAVDRERLTVTLGPCGTPWCCERAHYHDFGRGFLEHVPGSGGREWCLDYGPDQP